MRFVSLIFFLAACLPAAAADPETISQPAGFLERLGKVGPKIAGKLTQLSTEIDTALRLQSALLTKMVLELAVLSACIAVVGALLYRLLRQVADELAREAGPVPGAARTGARLLGAMVELAAALILWSIGLLVAMQLAGTSYSQHMVYRLAVDAVLVAALARAALRVLLRPDHPPLRLLGCADGAARFYLSAAELAVPLAAYGWLALAPILAGHVSPAAAQLVRLSVLLGLGLIALVVVLRARSGFLPGAFQSRPRRIPGLWSPPRSRGPTRA